MSLLGGAGLERVAALSVQRTSELVAALGAVSGVREVFCAPRFHEAVVALDRPVAPVLAGGDSLAVLSVRFARSAVTQQVIMERFLPALRHAAHGMVESFNRTSPHPSSQRARQSALGTTGI